MDVEVKKSFGRCCNKEGFFSYFYETLIASSDEIVPMFKGTDMERQKRLVRDGLNNLLLFADGSEYAKLRCKKIATVHDRNHVNVRPALYKLWVDSLMAALKKYDPQFNLDLEQHWRDALKQGIEYMQSMY
jgi:hemoglobin-like flavoprotein